ncbi:MAG: ADP-ribosylglycohydrolase family protein [Gemmatimonadales bacterium]|nr:ADP-ribosylglycohydrolase family protein [Gemmatimonadales bacterium]
MARILAEELAAGRRDVQSLALRWVARHLSEPRDIDPETGAALAHLARHGAPPSRAAGFGSDPLVRAVPVALATFDAPGALVSATYHIAALTHPDPLVAWSAVAVNVALARFLQGKRDFVPDVIEALRNNGVPEALLAAVRRIPLPAHAVTARESSVPGHALDDADAALRLAYHEPLWERGLHDMAGAAAAAGRAGLAGALLGARDGVGAIPAAWNSRVDADVLSLLAARLVRAEHAAVSPSSPLATLP